MEFKDIVKDAKLLALLKTFMTNEHNVENLDFLTSKDSNDKLYAKYISAKSPTQVNLPSGIQSKLDELAGKKKWSEMSGQITAARTSITGLINMDTIKRFVVSKPYKDYEAANAPKAPPAPPKPAPVVAKPVAAKAAPDLTAAKSAVTKMEKDLTDGTTFLTTATATVKSKGKPADKEEVNRMFESGRMRHDKVHNAFTELLQKDKAFTRENFGPFFTKKDTFSKLWAEYRKLLGR